METDCNCLWKPLQVQRHHPPGQARPVQSLPFALPLHLPLPRLCCSSGFGCLSAFCLAPHEAADISSADCGDCCCWQRVLAGTALGWAWSQTLGKLLGQRKVYLIFVQCPATCPFLTLLIKTNCALLQVRQSKARDNTQQKGSKGRKGGGGSEARQTAWPGMTAVRSSPDSGQGVQLKLVLLDKCLSRAPASQGCA